MTNTLRFGDHSVEEPHPTEVRYDEPDGALRIVIDWGYAEGTINGEEADLGWFTNLSQEGVGRGTYLLARFALEAARRGAAALNIRFIDSGALSLAATAVEFGNLHARSSEAGESSPELTDLEAAKQVINRNDDLAGLHPDWDEDRIEEVAVSVVARLDLADPTVVSRLVQSIRRSATPPPTS